jgi:hypothetical protein
MVMAYFGEIAVKCLAKYQNQAVLAAKEAVRARRRLL